MYQKWAVWIDSSTIGKSLSSRQNFERDFLEGICIEITEPSFLLLWNERICCKQI